MRAVLSWFPPLLWIAAILYLSDELSSSQTSHLFIPLIRYLFPSLTPDTVELMHLGVRKAGHIAGYSITGLLWLVAVRATLRARDQSWSAASVAQRWSGKILLIVIALTAASASLDEYRQSFTLTRTASVWDVVLDVAGAMLTLAVFKLFAHRIEERRKRKAA